MGGVLLFIPVIRPRSNLKPDVQYVSMVLYVATKPLWLNLQQYVLYKTVPRERLLYTAALAPPPNIKTYVNP